MFEVIGGILIAVLTTVLILYLFLELLKSLADRSRSSEETKKKRLIEVDGVAYYYTDSEVAEHIRKLNKEVSFLTQLNKESTNRCLRLTFTNNRLKQELGELKTVKEELQCDLDKYKALYRSVNDEATALYVENLTLRKKE